MCRFQAIECFLANVKSTDAEDSEVWNPHAISRFEEITHGMYKTDFDFTFFIMCFCHSFVVMLWIVYTLYLEKYISILPF